MEPFRTQIYGHRGMGCSTALRFSTVPENTLTAFSHSLKLGCHGVEFDVFLTDFGEVVVCHGLEPRGYLYFNCLCLKDGKLEQFPRDLSAQNLNVSHENVVVRAPWKVTGVSTHEEMADYVSKLTQEEQERLTEEYVTSTEGFVSELTGDLERLPTLEDVFKTFGTKLKYNVELKGSKTELGPRVLEVIKKFQGVEVLISSFQWIPPPLPANRTTTFTDEVENQVETDPNRAPNDLLSPLVDNDLGVPLGLLFSNTVSLPTLGRMLQFVDKYKARFVNLSDAFWLREKPVLGLQVKGPESLRSLVDGMHREGVKVLVWSATPFDFPQHFHVYTDAKVDVVCPNNVKGVVSFHNQYYSNL